MNDSGDVRVGEPLLSGWVNQCPKICNHFGSVEGVVWFQSSQWLAIDRWWQEGCTELTMVERANSPSITTPWSMSEPSVTEDGVASIDKGALRIGHRIVPLQNVGSSELLGDIRTDCCQ